MNGVFLTGRLTKEIELRYTSEGNAVISFCLAVEKTGSRDAEADFIDCVAWRKTAEFIAKYFKKGDGIEIQGHIATRRYEDKNGTNKKVTEVVCDKVNFPKGKSNAVARDTAEATRSDEPIYYEVQDEGELPF